MSDWMACNYCTLQFYKRKYGKNNIRTRASKKMAGFIAVVLRGKGEIGWFMELSSQCCC